MTSAGFSKSLALELLLARGCHSSLKMASQRSWRNGAPRIKTSQEASSTARGPVKALYPFSESFAQARSHGSSQGGKRAVGASPERRPQQNAAGNLSGKGERCYFLSPNMTALWRHNKVVNFT